VFLCRLAERCWRTGRGNWPSTKYCHGARERPGVAELLLTPPTLWVTLQGLLLLGLVLWHYLPRFGSLRPAAPCGAARRRSSSTPWLCLLLRKGDHADAVRTVREAVVRRLEHDLGLPAGTTPDRLVEETSCAGASPRAAAHDFSPRAPTTTARKPLSSRSSNWNGSTMNSSPPDATANLFTTVRREIAKVIVGQEE